MVLIGSTLILTTGGMKMRRIGLMKKMAKKVVAIAVLWTLSCVIPAAITIFFAAMEGMPAEKAFTTFTQNLYMISLVMGGIAAFIALNVLIQSSGWMNRFERAVVENDAELQGDIRRFKAVIRHYSADIGTRS